MSLSGAVLPQPITVGSPSIPAALNMTVDQLLTTSIATGNLEQAYETLQPTTITDSVAQQFPSKDDAMEVDEPKNEHLEITDESPKLCDPGLGVVVAASSTDVTVKSEEQVAVEFQRQKNSQLQNENNSESRCSSSSQDDMWRPW